jgi:hypothetical protein
VRLEEQLSDGRTDGRPLTVRIAKGPETGTGTQLTEDLQMSKSAWISAASVVALLCCPGSSVLAQQADTGQPTTTAEEDQGGVKPIRKRLLTLRGGMVVRGSTRQDDGRWSWKKGGDWLPLPLGAVVSARAENEALGELSDRRRPLRKATAAERVPLVSWMLTTGLYSEALGELDRLLAESPDEPGVLALLDRRDLPVRAPSWNAADESSLEALLDYAARSPASLQELVVRQLAALPLAERRDLQPLLAARLGRSQALGRRFCALALRRLFPGFSVEELTRRAVLDPVEEVRVQAALALRDTGEESVIDPLARALGSASSTVRTHAAQSLGLSGFAAAVEPLALRLTTLKPGGGGGQLAPRGTIFVGRQIAYVQGFEAEVASGAVIVDPLIGTLQEGATLDVKVYGSSGGGYTYTHETKQLRGSLAKLTGADVRDTNGAWKQWWASNGEAWMRDHREAGESALRDGQEPGGPARARTGAGSSSQD